MQISPTFALVLVLAQIPPLAPPNWGNRYVKMTVACPGGGLTGCAPGGTVNITGGGPNSTEFWLVDQAEVVELRQAVSDLDNSVNAITGPTLQTAVIAGVNQKIDEAYKRSVVGAATANTEHQLGDPHGEFFKSLVREATLEACAEIQKNNPTLHVTC